MSSVRAHRVSFAFVDAAPLLEEAGFHLPEGWTGLVGSNGAGKSTLLRLINGDLEPTGGHFQFEPDGATVHLCPQEVEDRTEDLEAFAMAHDPVSRRLQGQLHVVPTELDRWETLSPGERKRWQIGAALAREPDVLLLDEPTNHLDADGRAWLLSTLQRHRGVGLVVSHDRTLLNALTTRTLRIHGGEARLWRGGYDDARREWEAEHRGRLETRQAAQDEARRLKQRLAQARREQESATAQRSVRKRMRSKYDSDARTLGAQTLAEWAEKGLGRQVEVVRREAEAAAEAVESLAVEAELGRSVFVDYERAPMLRLLQVSEDSLRVGGTEILRDVRLTVARDDRIWVRGANGAGKTTLLRHLLDGASIPQSRLLFVPQDLSEDEAVAILEEARGLPETERGRVLSLVAALGVAPARLLASRRPSPGEARKLLIATGLGRHVWGLVLDEPTNHLDLPSIERLEAALQSFPGALLVVTHDEQFGSRCARTVWQIADGEVSVSSL